MLLLSSLNDFSRAGKGRGVTATRDIAAGELLMTCPPFAFVCNDGCDRPDPEVLVDMILEQKMMDRPGFDVFYDGSFKSMRRLIDLHAPPLGEAPGAPDVSGSGGDAGGGGGAQPAAAATPAAETAPVASTSGAGAAAAPGSGAARRSAAAAKAAAIRAGSPSKKAAAEKQKEIKRALKVGRGTTPVPCRGYHSAMVQTACLDKTGHGALFLLHVTLQHRHMLA